MRYYSKYIMPVLLSGCITGLLAGCSKNIDIDAPIDQLTTGAVFSDSATAISAVSGVYGTAIKGNVGSMSFINGFTSVLPGLSADELVTTAASPVYDEFSVNELSARNNTLNTSNWSDAYSMIFQCNLILENLERSTALSLTLKNQLGGEMLFMRALLYFYLTNEYGNVPLVTGTDYKENTALANSDSAAIYARMVQDLTEAQGMLPDTYAGPAGQKIRPNKMAATALLARVYLYQKLYAKAVEESSKVIDSHLYSLTGLSETFLANNSEAIMQFAPAIALYLGPAESYFLLPASPASMPAFELCDELLNAFEADDQRKVNWIGTVTVNGNTYSYLNKAKIRFHPYNTVKPEYIIVLRLAEQYLIRAEANAYLNNLGDAIADLDMIRDRADLPLIATTDPDISQNELIDAVFHENRIEFFMEWGHRWFDLKRRGHADQVLSPIKGDSWQPTDKLYPFPQDELLTAPNLIQNEGYAK